MRRYQDYTGKGGKVFSALVLLLLSPALYCMDWPSGSGLVVKNFGQNEEGSPRLGISVESGETFSAAERGELLYRRKEGDTASRLPSPLGSWTALDHGDGIVSIYGRFDGGESGEIPANVERGRSIGEPGISGWSNVTGFYFQLFDRKERRWINPAMIIGPPEDTSPPAIQAVKVQDESGTIFDLSVTRNLRQGRYAVLVDAFDPGSGENTLAPFRILCSLNGVESGSLNFETFHARNGSLRTESQPARRIYAPVPGYEAAELRLTRGNSTLEIIARDIAGNSRSVVYQLTAD